MSLQQRKNEGLEAFSGAVTLSLIKTMSFSHPAPYQRREGGNKSQPRRSPNTDVGLARSSWTASRTRPLDSLTHHSLRLMSLATQFDQTRESITERYRRRIEQGDRTKLTRDERETLTVLLLDQLIALNQRGEDTRDKLQALCEAEKALLEAGYPQGSINSVYLPAYTQVIKEAIAQGRLLLTEQNSHSKPWTKLDGSETGLTQTHYALDYLTYDLQTQKALRAMTTAKNNERQDSLATVNLERYLAQCGALLDSGEPETLALALVTLTGRRHTEIVSKGTFTATDYPYKLHFEGQQKDPTPPFDILTLIPAKELLPHLERFRAMPSVQALQGLGHDDPAIDAFNGRVNRRTAKYFGALVPVLAGFKTVSIHRLRALYGAIIIHYFCPEHKNEHRFLQHYLGHLLEEQGQKLPNAAATQHYFHYQLVNEQGKRLTARGLKVMANGLPPTPTAPTTDPLPASQPEPLPSVEREAQRPATETAPAPAPKSAKRSAIHINGDTRDRWLTVLHHFAPEGTSQHAKMAVLLERLEALVQGDRRVAEAAATDEAATVEETAITTMPAVSEPVEVNLPVKEQTINYQAQTLAWLTTEVEQLRRQVTQLQTERDQAIAQTHSGLEAELAHLRAENVQLRQAQAKLEAFRKLLTNGNGQEDVTAPALTTTVAPTAVVTTPTMTPPITSDPKQTTPPVVVKPASPPQRRLATGAQARATAIFAAVCQWNDTPGRTLADKWCVTSSFLETQFGIHRQAVKEWFAVHGSDVEVMHAAHGITQLRTQNRGKDVTALKAFIASQQLEA
jgi:Telomere resolvase